MKDSTFYSTAAQVIPVFLLAALAEGGFFRRSNDPPPATLRNGNPTRAGYPPE